MTTACSRIVSIVLTAAGESLIAMSGGVDSSVSVKLLLDEGYDVAGATMRLYSNEDIGLDKTRTCCSLNDVEDARFVAFKLGIDFHVFNFSDDFKHYVCLLYTSPSPRD